MTAQPAGAAETLEVEAAKPSPAAAAAMGATVVTFAPGTLLMAALLTVLTSSQGLLTTASKTGDGYAYDFATVPFLAEITKLCISYFLLVRQRAADPGSIRITKDWRTVSLFIVPSIIYMVHNNVAVSGPCTRLPRQGGAAAGWTQAQGWPGHAFVPRGNRERARRAGGCLALPPAPPHPLLAPPPCSLPLSCPPVLFPEARGRRHLPDPEQPQDRQHRHPAARGPQPLPVQAAVDGTAAAHHGRRHQPDQHRLLLGNHPVGAVGAIHCERWVGGGGCAPLAGWPPGSPWAAAAGPTSRPQLFCSPEWLLGKHFPPPS